MHWAFVAVGSCPASREEAFFTSLAAGADWNPCITNGMPCGNDLSGTCSLFAPIWCTNLERRGQACTRGRPCQAPTSPRRSADIQTRFAYCHQHVER